MFGSTAVLTRGLNFSAERRAPSAYVDREPVTTHNDAPGTRDPKGRRARRTSIVLRGNHVGNGIEPNLATGFATELHEFRDYGSS